MKTKSIVGQVYRFLDLIAFHIYSTENSTYRKYLWQCISYKHDYNNFFHVKL